ncbi:MAG: hypothetical protein ACK40O_08630 [Allosphingosinicella sp.]
MKAQDDKSEICGLAARIEDVAQLYDEAAAKVEDADTASCLAARAKCRRQMADDLLARAGLSGEAPGSLLPLPEAVWLKASSILSGSDEALMSPLRAADRQLLDAVTNYLKHSDASGRPAAAAKRLRERLEREIGPNGESAAPQVQPG